MMVLEDKCMPVTVDVHGRGEVIEPAHAEFAKLSEHFPANPGVRAIVRVGVSRVSCSCGFSVPFFDYRDHRDTLDKWAEAKGKDGVSEYRRAKNQKSIDGLPAFRFETEQ